MHYVKLFCFIFLKKTDYCLEQDLERMKNKDLFHNGVELG